MHPDAAFRWPKNITDREERAAMEAMIADIGFAMIFATTPDGPRVAHAPVFSTGDGALQFHLSNSNALTKHITSRDALCVLNGPEAYISPDWYGMEDQVPTWNYLSLELEGPVRVMEREGLIALLDDLSEVNEAKLKPKTSWHRRKMNPVKFEKMVEAITGFELEIMTCRSTVKLGQNKPEAARHKVADALDSNGRKAMAHMMRGVGRI